MPNSKGAHNIMISPDIGIIGGADGPTAIFVAGPKISVLSIVLGVIAIAVVAAAIIFTVKRNKKN